MEVTKVTRKAAYAMRKKPSFVSAVLVAAGNAQRMGGIDKVMTTLGQQPLLLYPLRTLQNTPRVKEIIVVTRQDLIVPISALVDEQKLDKVKMVVCGGKTRTESVKIGLSHTDKKADLVAIHDAARPFVSQRLIERTLFLATKHGAAAPALPVKDTIKCAQGHIVVSTPERKTLFAVQTPQCFDRDLFRAALQKAEQDKLELTDDCMAMEHLGMSVFLAEGEERNFKVTTPADLLIAEAVLQEKSEEA